MVRTRIRKAVIPAAGLGTRMLPASKAVPKELLPLVDKPVIQYIVEGAVQSGIEEVVIVLSRAKRSIRTHFQRSRALEQWLQHTQREHLVASVRAPSALAKFVYAWQEQPLGNGHAVLMAREAIGDEPFVMLWGDYPVLGDPPLAAQLIAAYEATSTAIVAVAPVALDEVGKFGMVETAGELGASLAPAVRIVEKSLPPPGVAPLAALGGYVLPPEIFAHLDALSPGQGGEIWLVDAVQRLAEAGQLHALTFTGRHYDMGNVLDYLVANIEIGLTRPELGAALRARLLATLGIG
jgi:UTP--glucose-1-phosphate uridylyltransferase